jgi:hypothetical protein
MYEASFPGFKGYAVIFSHFSSRQLAGLIFFVTFFYQEKKVNRVFNISSELFTPTKEKKYQQRA